MQLVRINRLGLSNRTLYDPDALAWANAVVAAGGAVSSQRLGVVAAFILAEKAAGCWVLTDDYWPLWGENAVQSLVSLKQRRLATVVNAPTFVADRHYAFDGASSYINTGFVPSTHGIAYTGNVQRIAAYERANVASSGVAAGCRVGTSSSISISPRNASSLTGSTNHTAGAVNFVLSPADSTGLKAISRAGGTTALGYDRGVRKTDVTGLTIGGSAAPGVALFIGAFNSSGTAISFRPASIGFVAIGAPLSDAQEAAQNSNVQQMAAAIGAAV